MKILIATALIMLMANCFASDANCTNCSATPQENGSHQKFKKDDPNPIGAANLYLSFSTFITQNRSNGNGEATSPPTFEGIIIKDGEAKTYRASITMMEILPISTSTTQNGGCIFISGTKITCDGIERYSNEENSISAISSKLTGIDFIRHAKMNESIIKKIILDLTNKAVQNLAISDKPAKISCSGNEGATLSCMITLPYTATFSSPQK